MIPAYTGAKGGVPDHRSVTSASTRGRCLKLSVGDFVVVGEGNCLRSSVDDTCVYGGQGGGSQIIDR